MPPIRREGPSRRTTPPALPPYVPKASSKPASSTKITSSTKPAALQAPPPPPAAPIRCPNREEARRKHVAKMKLAAVEEGFFIVIVEGIEPSETEETLMVPWCVSFRRT